MAPNGEGIIQGLYQKEDPNFGPYWTVKISGEEYTAFDRRLIRNLTPGEQVSYKWADESGMKGLMAIRPAGTEPGQESLPDARELHVRYLYDRQPREVRIKLERGRGGQYAWELSYEGEDAEEVIQRLKEVDKKLREEFSSM